MPGPWTATRLVFRCDGSRQIGFGHVSRCLTLAAEFRRQGADTWFVLKDLDKEVIGRIRREGHACEVLPADIVESVDVDRTRRVCEGISSVLVTDSHEFGRLYYEALHESGVPTVSFDDYAGVAYASDIVVNHNITAGKFAYDLAPHTIALLGPKYFPLRSPFGTLRAKDRPVRQRVESLLVALGGMPEPDTAAIILDGVRDWAGARGVSVKVAVGVQAGAEVFGRLEPKLPPLSQLLVNPGDFGELMWNADMAIVNGSLIAYEAASIGTPMVMTAVSENQADAVAGFNESGAALTLPAASVLMPQDVSETIEALAERPEERRRLSGAGRMLIDGEGSARIMQSVARIVADRSMRIGKGA